MLCSVFRTMNVKTKKRQKDSRVAVPSTSATHIKVIFHNFSCFKEIKIYHKLSIVFFVIRLIFHFHMHLHVGFFIYCRPDIPGKITQVVDFLWLMEVLWRLLQPKRWQHVHFWLVCRPQTWLQKKRRCFGVNKHKKHNGKKCKEIWKVWMCHLHSKKEEERNRVVKKKASTYTKKATVNEWQQESNRSPDGDS